MTAQFAKTHSDADSKLLHSLKEAIVESGLESGMTVSFHHHLRNGDYVLNMVMDEIAELGIRDLTVNASSIFDVHEPLIKHIQSGVVKKLECNYMGAKVGRFISEGGMSEPVTFRTHGGRAGDIMRGASPIDVAFIAAPCADKRGNLTGKRGPSACGSLGYAMADAECADKVIAVTDYLDDYPLADYSICETKVDYVVKVDKIGDPKGIVSGTTRITRDPMGLLMAQYATEIIELSGLLQDGLSFQTGAGGASLAVAAYLKQKMLDKKIVGSFGMGGITSYLVDMLNEGCFQSLMDVQCFDLGAVGSIRENPKHREISAEHYASPFAPSALTNSLDVVILGATQVDLDFNVNVHTDSSGYIMGGSGGHSDTASGAKLAMIVAPLIRARMPLIVDRVQCISTPGSTVDVVVTAQGIAVNPRRAELIGELKAAHLPVFSIEELKAFAEDLTGAPKALPRREQTVAEVLYRDGKLIDTISSVR